MQDHLIGNSGSEKSTLAKSIEKQRCLSHLDLDTLAWQIIEVLTRRPLEESRKLIKEFYR
jgi:adenylate kinase family enzyme